MDNNKHIHKMTDMYSLYEVEEYRDAAKMLQQNSDFEFAEIAASEEDYRWILQTNGFISSCIRASEMTAIVSSKINSNP